jgi:hypothetical protein
MNYPLGDFLDSITQLFQKNSDFVRMHRVIRIGLFIILAFVSSGGSALGQQASVSPAKPSSAPTSTGSRGVVCQSVASRNSWPTYELDAIKML